MPVGLEQSQSFLQHRTDLSNVQLPGALSPASFLYMPCRQAQGLILPPPQKSLLNTSPLLSSYAPQLPQPHLSPRVCDGGCPSSKSSI